MESDTESGFAGVIDNRGSQSSREQLRREATRLFLFWFGVLGVVCLSAPAIATESCPSRMAAKIVYGGQSSTWGGYSDYGNTAFAVATEIYNRRTTEDSRIGCEYEALRLKEGTGPADPLHPYQYQYHVDGTCPNPPYQSPGRYAAGYLILVSGLASCTLANYDLRWSADNQYECVLRRNATACPSIEPEPGPPSYCPISDPISHATGNNFHVESTYQGGGAFPLKFEINYNSQTERYSPNQGLGQKWRHNYLKQVESEFGADGTVRRLVLSRDTGRSVEFIKVADGRWAPSKFTTLRLGEIVVNGAATGWRVIDADNVTEEYANDGSLILLRERTGLEQRLVFENEKRLFGSVRHTFGRTLSVKREIDMYMNGDFFRVYLPDGNYIGFNRTQSGSPLFVTYPNADTTRYRARHRPRSSGEHIPRVFPGRQPGA